MALAVKTPKRLSVEDIQAVLGDKGMQKFMERWAVHRVGFNKIPMLSVEALDSAISTLETGQAIRNPELTAIGVVALNYWTAVPNAKGRVAHWAKRMRGQFQQERDAVTVNGKKRRRSRRAK